MTQHVVTVRGLSVQRGHRRILDGLDLDVRDGESVSVVGRSGSGKSTLLAALLGLVAGPQGSVVVLGTDIGRLGRTAAAAFRARSIGSVFQAGELLPELSATDNVALPAMIVGRSAADARESARRSLTDLAVTDPDALARNLSGGERQRVALARALINRPALVLADEPTGALDPELRDVALDQLLGAVAASGASLVLVTHDAAVASRTDRTVRLVDGRLVELPR